VISLARIPSPALPACSASTAIVEDTSGADLERDTARAEVRDGHFLAAAGR
jgi:hypothetical protein